MADSGALRDRRYRMHRAGDHRLCAPDRECRAFTSGPVPRQSAPDGDEEVPECPVPLADDGARLWEGVLRQFELAPDELERLGQACVLLDRVMALDHWLERNGWTMPGRYAGMVVERPEIGIELKWRREFRMLLDGLHLPAADDQDVPLPEGVTPIFARPKRGRLPEMAGGS